MTNVPLCRVGSWLRLSLCDMMLELESMLVDLAKVALEPPFVFRHRFFSDFFVGFWFLFFISHFQLQMSSRQLDVVSLPFSAYWIIRVILADRSQSIKHTFEGSWFILFGILLHEGQLPIKCSTKGWHIICLFVAKGGVPNGLHILRYWHHGTEGQFVVWRDCRTTSSCFSSDPDSEHCLHGMASISSYSLFSCISDCHR